MHFSQEIDHDHEWFQVTEQEGGKENHEYRAIRLMHLASIRLNVRGDQGALAKMRTAVLRGLYNASVDIVYLVAGIYHPNRLGCPYQAFPHRTVGNLADPGDGPVG